MTQAQAAKSVSISFLSPVDISKKKNSSQERLQLALPVMHPLFIKYLAELIGVEQKKLKDIIYYRKYLKYDESDFYNASIINVNKYFKEIPQENIKLGTGADILLQLLTKYDNEGLQILEKTLLTAKQASLDQLPVLTKEAETEPAAIKGQKKGPKARALSKLKRLLEANTKRLNRVQTFLATGIEPKSMIMTQLPLLPQELRPISQLRDEKAQFIKDPLNVAYERLLLVNKTLEKLKKDHANPAFLNLEGCRLQAYVDGLIAKGEFNLLSDVSYYKSLLERLSHKKGIIRDHLLGKRVNYSARSVIITDPKLKFSECGIPKVMALELFRPFLIKQLKQAFPGKKYHNSSANNAINHTLKRLQENLQLEKSEPDNPVLVALKEVIKNKVILLGRNPSLHRLSLQAFYPVLKDDLCIHINPLVCAGFNADFDGDAMFLTLPLSKTAQKEAREKMLSTENLLSPGKGTPIAELSQGMILGIYKSTMAQGEATEKLLEYEDVRQAEETLTKEAASRRIAVSIPGSDHPDYPSDYTEPKLLHNTSLGLIHFNDEYIPIELKKLRQYEFTDLKETSEEKVFNGFDKHQLERMIENSYLPDNKAKTVEFLSKLMEYGFHKASEAGISFAITDFPSMDKATETIGQVLKRTPSNPLSIIYRSGARGKEEQWNQLRGKRGFFEDATGETVPLEVTSDFYEGLSPYEFFVAGHGTRSGVADTALKTAESGALARNLVLALQDLVITEADCCAELPEVKLPSSRSPITCRAKKGLCQACYGNDPTTRKPVRLGTHVGVIAAQSLTEPTTQFILRTFHSGGTQTDEKITEAIPALRKLFLCTDDLLVAEFKQQQPDYQLAKYLMDRILAIYHANRAEVRQQHLEVLIREILRFDEKGICTELIGIKKAIKEKKFLTQLGFENPGKVLAEAVISGAEDDLSNLNSRILLGKVNHDK